MNVQNKIKEFYIILKCKVKNHSIIEGNIEKSNGPKCEISMTLRENIQDI